MNATLMRLMIVGLASPLMLGAQLPPKPPTQAVPPKVVLPPRMPDMPDVVLPPMDFGPLMDKLADVRLNEMDWTLQDMTLRASEMALRANDVLAKMDVANLTHTLDVAVNVDFPKSFDFDFGDKLLRGHPARGWVPDDPADSLYRLAREALNRGEYRRSAQLFSEITKKFPKSQYAQDCAYWEAFSRYRLGGTPDLQQALQILDGLDVQAMMRTGRGEGTIDIPTLRARIQGVLAARGDKNAEASLKKEAASNDGCDREAVSVRAEALGALGQMDMQAAMPSIRKVLAKRDDCTVELRRRALYLIARQPDSASASMILDVAKNDTDPGIRSEAMRWLPRVSGDNAIPILEEILKTSNDEQTQRSAISALSSMDSDRARRSLRAIIERNDVPERVRYDAIVSFSREREGRPLSADEVTYLRSLYTKVESQRLREAVLVSVSRIDTPETLQFLLGVARSENESASLRSAAIQRIGRMTAVSVSDIAKLYDVADARSLREGILYALFQRKEPEATDKMMEIARKDTDPQIRQRAISLLARRNDPRAKELLARLIDQP